MKLVTYSVDKDTDYSAIKKLIKSQNSWACLSENTWLIGGELTYLQLRDMLVPFKPHNLVVISFGYENWATFGCSKEINEYLRNNVDYEW